MSEDHYEFSILALKLFHFVSIEMITVRKCHPWVLGPTVKLHHGIAAVLLLLILLRDMQKA
jgi:hypothetical protein